jgi:peptidoglycan/LPS O-acetylase OafA/YrhL
VWVSWRGLALILLSSGIVLAFGINTYAASGLGAFWQTAGYGLVRTVFSFALGVGMQRLHAKLEVRRQETMKALLVPIALFVLLTQMPGGQPYWDKVCVFLFLPALLWFGAVWEVPHAEPFRTLGEISYPLYCIHGAVLQATHGSRPHTYLWIALIVTAWLASRADRPIRLWLMQHRRILRAPTKPLPSQPLA